MSESIEKIDSNLHFILCKERTGSSLLTAMLNCSDEVLAVAEETFSLYLYPKYGKVISWSDESLRSFFKDFVLMSKKNLDLYFTNVNEAQSQFLKLEDRNQSYLEVCLHLYKLFFPNKNKDNVKVFVDKQIDYLFHLEQLQKVFSRSKFVILVRDPRDNIEACIRRKLGNLNIRYQSYLWNLYYQNVISKVAEEKFLLVKYEDLILKPKETLELICDHISIKYSDSMLNYSSGVKDLLDFKKDQVDEGFKEEFASFHEGLTKSLDASKIGSYKAFFTAGEVNLINSIVGSDAIKLGYDIESEILSWKIVDFYWRVRAKSSKKWLLNFYSNLPVSFKLFIKKIRSKKVDV